MSAKPKITVIVPVYNVEKYLERCVKSVIEQSFSDFELLLVDDCSPDKSGVLCDELAMQDERIKVIHREKNGGLSAARNSGLEKRNGEYLFFLDSDDFLHKEALQTVFEDITLHNADVAVIDIAGVSMEESKAPDCGDGDTTVLKGKEALVKTTAECVRACGKLFRSSLFDEFRFIEGKWHEDVHMSARIFLNNEITVVFNKKKLYCYRENPQSFMRSKLSEKRIDDALYMFEDRVNLFASKKIEEARIIAAKKHLHMAKMCYIGAKEDLNDKVRMKLAHASFKRVFETLDKGVFDKDTYKLHRAFAKMPGSYQAYEKTYWLVNGITHSIKRRIKRK